MKLILPAKPAPTPPEPKTVFYPLTDVLEALLEAYHDQHMIDYVSNFTPADMAQFKIGGEGPAGDLVLLFTGVSIQTQVQVQGFNTNVLSGLTMSMPYGEVTAKPLLVRIKVAMSETMHKVSEAKIMNYADNIMSLQEYTSPQKNYIGLDLAKEGSDETGTWMVTPGGDKIEYPNASIKMVVPSLTKLKNTMQVIIPSAMDDIEFITLPDKIDKAIVDNFIMPSHMTVDEVHYAGTEGEETMANKPMSVAELKAELGAKSAQAVATGTPVMTSTQVEKKVYKALSVDEAATLAPPRLCHAEFLYQRVRGTSGADYYTVALGKNLKAAMKLKGDALAFRYEGNALTSPDQKAWLETSGFTIKPHDSGVGFYASIHVHVGSSPALAAKTIMSMIAASMYAFDTTLPSFERIKQCFQ